MRLDELIYLPLADPGGVLMIGFLIGVMVTIYYATWRRWKMALISGIITVSATGLVVAWLYRII